jgi:hypothetical protein
VGVWVCRRPCCGSHRRTLPHADTETGRDLDICVLRCNIEESPFLWRWCTAPPGGGKTTAADTYYYMKTVGGWQEAGQMRYPKRTQYKHCKKKYRVTNWSDYDRALCKRGDLTVWISQAALDGWHSMPRGRPGGQQLYSRLAIETAVTVRMILHLPLRQTEGFLRSLARLLDLPIEVPDHTTISRRAKKLGRLPLYPPVSQGPVHLVVDSTGLSVHVGARRKPPKRSA